MLTVEQIPLNEMIRDAERTFPDECCGFLFGNTENGNRSIIKIQVVDNAKEGDKKRRFVISARDYMRAEQFAEINSLELLGVYHSHPGHPAIPSEHDRVAAQPYFSYIILSVLNSAFDHIRSWQLNEESQFEEEKILFNN